MVRAAFLVKSIRGTLFHIDRSVACFQEGIRLAKQDLFLNGKLSFAKPFRRFDVDWLCGQLVYCVERNRLGFSKIPGRYLYCGTEGRVVSQRLTQGRVTVEAGA